MAIEAGLGDQGLAQPEPTNHQMAKGLKIQRGIGQCTFGLAGPANPVDGFGGLNQALQGLGQTSGVVRQRWHSLGFVDGAANAVDQDLVVFAVVQTHLAPQQVQALDAVGAFVDGVEAVVPVELLDRVLPGVAVAAVDLDRQAVGFQAELGRPGLDHRGQQIQQAGGLGAGFGGFGEFLFVHQYGALQAQ